MSRGEIINLKVYQRVVDDYNVMRKHDAVGLSEKILLELLRSGIHLIRILRVYKDRPAVVYFTTVSMFLKSDLTYEYIKGDKNKFVSFSNMIVHDRSRQKKIGDII